MIIEQHLEIIDPKTMEMKLTNRYDTSTAMELAKEASDNGGRGPNSDMMPLGYIPPEEWDCNPWLMEADRARMAGDVKTYHDYVMKFFKLFPQYAVLHSRKYY